MNLELQIMMALLLDSIAGDPRWMPHPVCLIGRYANWLERKCRRVFPSESMAGWCTVTLVLFGTGVLGWTIVELAGLIHPWAADGVSIYLLYTCFAARDLIDHSRKVVDALRVNDLFQARSMVGMIVGRDTTELDQDSVVRACVESVAENTVDGVTAPLFWAAIGGPVGVLLYKAVNTMDSLFGYTNEQYMHFGRTAARLDDLINWLPARITGILLVFSSWILRMRSADAWHIFYRDRLKHASPNSGHAEAAVAGALGIQLGGLSHYFGKPKQKPVIGDDRYSPKACHIVQTQVLMVAATALMAVLLVGVRMCLSEFFG